MGQAGGEGADRGGRARAEAVASEAAQQALVAEVLEAPCQRACPVPASYQAAFLKRYIALCERAGSDVVRAGKPAGAHS